MWARAALRRQSVVQEIETHPRDGSPHFPVPRSLNDGMQTVRQPAGGARHPQGKCVLCGQLQRVHKPEHTGRERERDKKLFQQELGFMMRSLPKVVLPSFSFN